MLVRFVMLGGIVIGAFIVILTSTNLADFTINWPNSDTSSPASIDAVTVATLAKSVKPEPQENVTNIEVADIIETTVSKQKQGKKEFPAEKREKARAASQKTVLASEQKQDDMPVPDTVVDSVIANKNLAPVPDKTPRKILTALDKTNTSASPFNNPIQEASPQWQAILQPFNTRFSATKFARHLSKKTGSAYRVLAEQNKHYQLYMRYQDETARESQLAELARALGISEDQL